MSETSEGVFTPIAENVRTAAEMVRVLVHMPAISRVVTLREIASKLDWVASQVSEVEQRAANSEECREALNAVMEWWQGTSEFANGEDEMPAAIFDAARAAVTKAKGGAK